VKIYFDHYQEGRWFEELHPRLNGAQLAPFPFEGSYPSELLEWVQRV
jgi:hypothetical protein